MRHSFAKMLSNRTKRITLLTYIMMIPNVNAATTSTAISAANSAGSIPPKAPGRESREVPGCCGKLKLDPLNPPPEPSSPASSPTIASLVHWPTRNGLNNCCLVCSMARGIVSTDEIGKVHLAMRTAQEQVTANCAQDQINFERSLGIRK